MFSQGIDYYAYYFGTVYVTVRIEISFYHEELEKYFYDFANDEEKVYYKLSLSLYIYPCHKSITYDSMFIADPKPQSSTLDTILLYNFIHP